MLVNSSKTMLLSHSLGTYSDFNYLGSTVKTTCKSSEAAYFSLKKPRIFISRCELIQKIRIVFLIFTWEDYCLHNNKVRNIGDIQETATQLNKIFGSIPIQAIKNHCQILSLPVCLSKYWTTNPTFATFLPQRKST